MTKSRSIPSTYRKHGAVIVGTKPKASGERRATEEKKPPLKIQERDWQIIQAVHDNRLLTKSLLLPLFPPDPDRTPDHLQKMSLKPTGTNLDRRLSKLFHHGYLERLRTVRGGELIYAITQEGLRLLKTHQPKLIMFRIDNRDLTLRYIDHALMVARFHTALQIGIRETRSMELEKFERESKDLKAEWKSRGKRLYVNPDAFFILKDKSLPEGRQRTAYFLEADRGTMPIQRTKSGTDIASKLNRYSEMYAQKIHQEFYGIPNFRVLVVTNNTDRARNIINHSSKEIRRDHRSFFFITTEQNYTESLTNILAAIWRSADNPDDPRGIISSPLRPK